METVPAKVGNYFIQLKKLKNNYSYYKDKEIVRFFNEVSFRIDFFNKYYNEVNKKVSPDFNVFDYIEPDENRFSDILADLLNSKGKHGQGDMFFKEFLKLLGIPINPKMYDVKREVYTDLIGRNLRRLDILIDLGSIGIMIENKPWAVEQKQQISDYAKYLNKRYDGAFYIIYLSKIDNLPSIFSIPEADLNQLIETGKFIHFSFEKMFKDWLSNSIKICESEKVKSFLNDFNNYSIKALNN